MTLPINLSTGPVNIPAAVLTALSAQPVSHRSSSFMSLYRRTTEKLCSTFNVAQTFLLTGSGTMANECMLQEIKQVSGRGLMLANGEFGCRLIRQASRNGLSFLPLEVAWGEVFDLVQIERVIRKFSIKWILFTHCETSTGVINDLDSLAAICQANDCGCYVDCMSTAGTRSLDLSGVTMATASSGKGLASIPGLGIVLSNIRPVEKINSPAYLDLANYDRCDGVPFTLSSNILASLSISIKEKLTKAQFHHSEVIRNFIFSILNERRLVPFATPATSVFTIVPQTEQDQSFVLCLKQKLILSSESDYLRKRGWHQLAIFGCYTYQEIQELQQIFRAALDYSYAPGGMSIAYKPTASSPEPGFHHTAQ